MTKYRMLVSLVLLFGLTLGGFWMASWGFMAARGFVPPGEATDPPNPGVSTPIPVEVIKPERRAIIRSLTLPGSFSAFEEVTLYAKVAGYLESISVDIGDWVPKGRTLAVLDVPELSAEHETARAKLLEARTAVQRAQSQLLRSKADLALKQLTLDRLVKAHEMEPEAIAPQEVDVRRGECEMAVAAVQVARGEIEVAKAQVEAAQAELDRLSQMLKYTRIVAPFSGFVTQRHVHPGALIPSGTNSSARPVVTLARTDILRFSAAVPEPDVPFLSPRKTETVIRLDALSEQTFRSTVTRISQSLNPQTRTMLVEINLSNRKGLLKPGMYGSVELKLDSNPNGLVIPAAAIVMEAGKPQVLQVVDGRVKKVPIRVGSDDGIQVEVLAGLDSSDLIVLSGKNLVRPGDPVIPHLKGGENAPKS